ncbi:MAG: polysaccharide deacetylase family protein [Phycisphaerae bacterium]|jgi:peptidoglycan/xylan/chitin deacetylase (PgdA/CDA1 family)
MKLALRIDDIGASSKKFELYSKQPVGNLLFLKYLRSFRAWGPYEELSTLQWQEIFDILKKTGVKLTIAITAAWVERDGRLIPFPQKFPQQAAALKKALDEGLIEIANHGLSHCVIGKHLPRLFTSNRKFHREFWPWLDENIHYEHIKKSQQILQEYFEIVVTTLVPPGNVFSEATIKAAAQFGIKLINCNTKSKTINSIRILGNENVFAFHDRDIMFGGTEWLEKRLQKKSGVEYCFVSEL